MIKIRPSKEFVKIEKRLRFVISALILTGLLVVATFFSFNRALYALPVVILATYFFTYFSIVEGIEKIEWLTLFFMPLVVTISFYFFYFLFPGRWLTRLPFALGYFISIYAVLLCSNIFNVGVEKSLQLYRAAFSINFFYETIALFFISNIFLSTKQGFFINGIALGGISFIFSIYLFWTIRLKDHFERESLNYALLIGTIFFEIAVILSLIPIKSTIFSLFITTSFYSLTGLIYSYIDQRLFKETIREYLVVLAFVSLILLLTLSW